MKNPSWKIIHIGYLKQNRYWGENIPVRNQTCTSTFIAADNRKIVVDPGIETNEAFQRSLFQRTGYTPGDIDTVFLTHFHRNHWLNLSLFQKSVWLMSRAEIRWWQQREQTTEHELDLLARMVPMEEHALPGIEILPTPGHTHGSTSILFETREGMVIVAGDAILTFDHFDDREVADTVEDQREAQRSIDRIAKMADIVIPGHDNYFVV